MFAFRVHQFLGKGDTADATLEPEEARYITVEGQAFKPQDRGKILLPLALCRECGQEYYVVVRSEDGCQFPPSGGRATTLDNGLKAGFLHVDTRNPWPDTDDEIQECLPDSWLTYEGGVPRVLPARRDEVPRPVRVGTNGVESPGELRMVGIPAPLRFCLNCGVRRLPMTRSDLSKLTLHS